jgi:hypothetical protein
VRDSRWTRLHATEDARWGILYWRLDVVEYRVMLEDSRTNKKLDPDGSPLTDTKDLWSRLPKFDSKADAKAYCDEMVERHPHVICSINTPTGPGGTAQEILRVRNRRVFEEQLRAHRERVRQEEKAKPKEGSAGRKPSCPRCGQGRLRMTLRDGDRQGYWVTATCAIPGRRHWRTGSFL